MPYARRRVGYFVTEEPDPVVARIGLVLGDCRPGTCPSLDGGLHSHCGGGWCKRITASAAADREPAVRGVVIHVTLPRVRLTPTVFVRSDVRSFGVIGRARVLARVQIA